MSVAPLWGAFSTARRLGARRASSSRQSQPTQRHQGRHHQPLLSSPHPTPTSHSPNTPRLDIRISFEVGRVIGKGKSATTYTNSLVDHADLAGNPSAPHSQHRQTPRLHARPNLTGLRPRITLSANGGLRWAGVAGGGGGAVPPSPVLSAPPPFLRGGPGA